MARPPRSFAQPTAALWLALLCCAPARADAPEREIGPDAKGEVYAWQASNGLRYEYYVPKDYDHERGAALTLVLHGSNLDRRWGFANHQAGSFRPRDVVVCPDGSTSNGAGGFNSLQQAEDLERLHLLHAELRAALHLRATYVYGHSQGSFFAFYYAGHYPDEVQGVVGQASGVWIGTEMAKKGHHQGLVLMHGTLDPVVPYGQSVGGYEAFVDARYPLVRLRSLEGWNHWPNQLQTEQQLAWCQGMTESDVAELGTAFETLSGVKEWRDPVALYQIAHRLAEREDASASARADARKALDEIDGIARAHAAAIAKSLGKSKGTALEDDAWVGHLPLFLRQFRGVPACDELAAAWEKTLERQNDAASDALREWWRVRETDPKKAVDAGLELLQKGFLAPSASDEELLKQLEAWSADAKALDLSKSQKKALDATLPVMRSALEKGRKSFADVSKVFG